MVDKWMEATMRIREWPPKIEGCKRIAECFNS